MDQKVIDEISAFGAENLLYIHTKVSRNHRIPGTNLVLIGQGSSRTVFRYAGRTDSVFKLTRSEDNDLEFSIYETRLKPEDKQYFAAVKSLVQLNEEYSVLEMEFVPGKSLTQGVYDGFYDVYSLLSSRYSIGDMHGANYRIVDGKPKLVDYAYNTRWT